MNIMANALSNAGLTSTFVLSDHAKTRIRQRLGIESTEVATQWASDNIARATEKITRGSTTHYISDAFEIIADGLSVITVKPVRKERSYLERLGGVVEKEVLKMIADKEVALRRIEIVIAEHTLNQLKVRNPKTKSLIGRRLMESIDIKQRHSDELYAIKKAAGQYGVIT